MDDQDHDILIRMSENVEGIVDWLGKINGTVSINDKAITEIQTSRKLTQKQNCDDHKLIRQEIKGVSATLNDIPIRLSFKQFCIIIVLITSIAVGGSVGADEIIKLIT